MASPAASGSSSQVQISAYEQDIQQIMDLRKRKRMISNRESARRSRMRKQRRLDELMGQVSQLSNENSEIVRNVNITTQLYLNVEAENSILRAQMDELAHRLQSLNDIINCLNTTNNAAAFDGEDAYYDNLVMDGVDDFLNPWNLIHLNQPIMASADAFMY